MIEENSWLVFALFFAATFLMSAFFMCYVK